MARGQLQKVLDAGVWRTGTPTDKRTVPTVGSNDVEAVARLGTSVQRLLGHSNPSLTQRYAALRPEDLEGQVAVLD